VICVKLRSPHAGQQMEDVGVWLLMLKLGSCLEVEGSSGPVEGKHQSKQRRESGYKTNVARRCIFSIHYGSNYSVD